MKRFIVLTIIALGLFILAPSPARADGRRHRVSWYARLLRKRLLARLLWAARLLERGGGRNAGGRINGGGHHAWREHQWCRHYYDDDGD
jgi:hypothetical protein